MKAGVNSESPEAVSIVQDLIIDVPLGVESVSRGKPLPTMATSNPS